MSGSSTQALRENLTLAAVSLGVALVAVALLEVALRVVGIGDPDASRASRLKYQQIHLPVFEEARRPDGTPIFRSADQPEPDATAAQPRILIPQEAVVRVGGETGAFLIERDAVRFTAIRTGMTKGGRVAVEAGLEPNQRIVLAPPPSLRDGDRIRLRND